MTSTDTAVRRASALAVALAVALVLAACSAPAGATSEEVQRWMSASSDGWPAEEGLGSAAGLIAPSDELEDEQVAQQPPAVSLSYESPAALDGVIASCFGEGTVDLTVHVTTSPAASTQTVTTTQTVATTFPDLPCGEDTELALEADGVTEVGFSVSGADRDGAWSAAVLGTPQG